VVFGFCCTCLGLVLAIVGLVLGIIGLKQIKTQGMGGRGLALGGVISSGVALALSILLLVLSLVLNIATFGTTNPV